MHALPSSGFAAKPGVHLVQVYGSPGVQAGVQNEATVLKYEFKLKVRSMFFNLNVRENFSYATCSWLRWGLVSKCIDLTEGVALTLINLSHNPSWFHIHWNKTAILIRQWLILLSWALVWAWLGSKKFTVLENGNPFPTSLSIVVFHPNSSMAFCPELCAKDVGSERALLGLS